MKERDEMHGDIRRLRGRGEVGDMLENGEG